MPLVRLLRILSTVLLGVAIGQAGFGSGLVGSVFAGAEDELLETLHSINAYLVLTMVIACLVAAGAYRRTGGPQWPLVFAASLLVASILQVVLGRAEVVGPHVFVGVLLLSAATTFCSYVWRHEPVATSASP